MISTQICHDTCTGIDAYEFSGTDKEFSPHFHPYYVIGLMICGERRLMHRGHEYALKSGDVMLLEPGDIHSCICTGSTGSRPMSYMALNISPERTPCFPAGLIRFSEPITNSRAIYNAAGQLCRAVIQNTAAVHKRELLSGLTEALLSEYGRGDTDGTRTYDTAAEAACRYIEAHFSENISLKQICGAVFMSRASLIREFAAVKGISPCRYLKNIRLCNAQRLLEKGYSPADAAAASGFADQSHFTHSFKAHTGFTPSVYRRIFNERQD